MLHYEGLITEPIINVENYGDPPNLEILKFYDDELPEESCGLIQEILQEYFNSDTLIHVYYEKDKDRAVIELTKYFDKKEDISILISKFKSSFEEFYNKTFH